LQPILRIITTKIYRNEKNIPTIVKEKKKQTRIPAAEWPPKMAERCWHRAEQKVEPSSLLPTNFEIFPLLMQKQEHVFHILCFFVFLTITFSKTTYLHRSASIIFYTFAQHRTKLKNIHTIVCLMNIKSPLNKMLGDSIGKNFLAIIVVALVLLILLLFYLRVYTRHNQNIYVPKLEGLQIEEASSILKSKGLNIEITDSIFRKDAVPGAIIEQTPKPNSRVKTGRNIYVSIYSKTTANFNSRARRLLPASSRSSTLVDGFRPIVY